MSEVRLTAAQKLVLALILFGTGLVRSIDLGHLSYWYDEVVTIRLAQTPAPGELIDLLNQIDATRAPLHPVILQRWVKVFGPTEASSRSFSVLCGILTVLLVYRLGRLTFRDNMTGIWAAFLAAISPLLIVYSRETRMYAWLVLVTCFAWECLFRLKEQDNGEVSTARRWGVSIAYTASVVALIYSHPLGLLMAGTLGVVSILFRISWKRLAAVYLVVAVGIAPWVARYFDHDPESSTGRLPLKYLLVTPIGFVGGNFATLAFFCFLIGYALTRVSREKPRFVMENPSAAVGLLAWLILPPVVLYLYSMVAHPIFGPARYTLFVAPAFLLLVARGLARLPAWAGLFLGIAISVLAAMLWTPLIFSPDLKADWRAAAAFLNRDDPAQAVEVHVVATEGGPNVEVETARYYLGGNRAIQRFDRETTGFVKPAWLAVGLRNGLETGEVPAAIRGSKDRVDFDGLRLYRIQSPNRN